MFIVVESFLMFCVLLKEEYKYNLKKIEYKKEIKVIQRKNRSLVIKCWENNGIIKLKDRMITLVNKQEEEIRKLKVIIETQEEEITKYKFEVLLKRGNVDV